MTTVTVSHRIEKQKSHPLPFPSIPWKAVYGVGGLALFLLMMVYVFQINQLTQASYLIKNDNKKIETLLTENKMLETGFAESSFLGQVRDRATALHFEKTTQVSYLQMADTSLARAQ